MKASICFLSPVSNSIRRISALYIREEHPSKSLDFVHHHHSKRCLGATFGLPAPTNCNHTPTLFNIDRITVVALLTHPELMYFVFVLFVAHLSLGSVALYQTFLQHARTFALRVSYPGILYEISFALSIVLRLLVYIFITALLPTVWAMRQRLGESVHTFAMLLCPSAESRKGEIVVDDRRCE